MSETQLRFVDGPLAGRTHPNGFYHFVEAVTEDNHFVRYERHGDDLRIILDETMDEHYRRIDVPTPSPKAEERQ